MQNGTIEIAGAIVFWNVAAETDRNKLVTELTAIGQEQHLPGVRTAFAAAKQACLKKFRGDGFRIDKLKDGNGVTVERVERGELDNTYSQVAYMLVDDENNLVEVCRVVDPSIGNPAQIESELIDAFQVELGLCAANAVGLALARAVEAHSGYRLRPTGGVYFLPNFESEAFEKIAKVFEACGARGETMVHRMEVAKGDQTIRAVHSTIREQINERIAEMREELASGDLKKAGRRNRTEELTAMIDRVSKYENLLDQSLAEVRKDLDDVRVQMSMEQVSSAGSLFAGLSL